MVIAFIAALAGFCAFAAVMTSGDFLASFSSEKRMEESAGSPGFLGVLAGVLERVQPVWLEKTVDKVAEKYFEEKGYALFTSPYGLFIRGEVLFLLVFTVAAFTASLTLAVFAGTAAFFVPLLDVRSRRVALERETMRHFPFFLDLVGVSVEAGVDFMLAVERVYPILPPGRVKDAAGEMVKTVRLGSTRREALSTLAEQLPVKEVRDFVSATVQADRMGSGLSGVIRTFSRELRRKRFAEAEERAQEVPVKLMLPLLFIFVCNFIVITAPVIVRALGGGVLR